MDFGMLRKTISLPARTVRLKLFGNNQKLTVNLAYRRALTSAKGVWSGTPTNSQRVTKWKNQLHEQGFVQIEPTAESSILETIHQKVNACFAKKELCSAPIEGAVRLKNSIELVPEIIQLYTIPIIETIENYYQGHFKIYWTHIYRTEPSNSDPNSSFLWHVDNCPQQVVKLMVYLTDTKENTGAFRLKPRPLSKELLDRGFWDRSKNDRFSSVLNDNSTTKVFEGPKGTSILFLNWGCVHRAKHPESGYRDVVVFFMVPSDVPWNQNLKQNIDKVSRRDDVCTNPAKF